MRRPPLAEFGADAADAACSFGDHTMGVGGAGVRSRRARWRSGSRRSSTGYTETGIIGEESLGHHLHDCLLALVVVVVEVVMMVVGGDVVMVVWCGGGGCSNGTPVVVLVVVGGDGGGGGWWWW